MHSSRQAEGREWSGGGGSGVEGRGGKGRAGQGRAGCPTASVDFHGLGFNPAQHARGTGSRLVSSMSITNLLRLRIKGNKKAKGHIIGNF